MAPSIDSSCRQRQTSLEFDSLTGAGGRGAAWPRQKAGAGSGGPGAGGQPREPGAGGEGCGLHKQLLTEGM